jgi:hypothetical protein
MYKINEGSIQLDNMSIPLDPANRHYQEFLDWVIENGVADIDGGEEVVQEDYSVLRQQDYPDMATQLDMQYWDSVNGTTVWQDTIDAIKAKYPKSLVKTAQPKPVPTWVQEEADKKLFARQLAAYKQAVARLEHYVVADGRPEVKEMQPTGEQVFNEETGEMEDVMAEVVVQTAIEPLEPTIERTVYGDDPEAEPTVETIENPLITQDNLERAEAELIVSSIPQAVKEAYNV